VKQMKKSTVTGLLTVPGNLINSVTGTNIGNVLNAPINLTTKAFISKYSRGHEAEADEFGIQLAASAGYKTSALADALLRLSKEIELISGSAERRSYFSDHPFTPNRISKIQSSASLYKPVNPNPVAQSQKQFIMNFGGLCFGPNPEQGIFIDNLFIHPDMKFAWSTPESWVTINKPSVVAAYTEKGDAIIAMRMMDDKKTIQELGEEAKAKSSEAKGITIQQAGDTIINSFPAYILRLKITEKDQVAISEMIWLNYHDQLVQLAGVGAYEFRSVMHQSLCSFRNAKYEDLQLVTFFELNIARAQENETLARLTERVNNRLNPEFTAVINDKSNEDILKRGDLVKIVTMKPYQPKR
jgi:predicted Zn-dependent protease